MRCFFYTVSVCAFVFGLCTAGLRGDEKPARETAGAPLTSPVCGDGDALRAQQLSQRGVPPCPYSISTLAGYTADDGDTVDVMMVYTADARDQAGGDAVIQSRMDTAVATANQILSDSGLSVQMNIVHKALISYTESGDYLTDLNRLTEPGDGFLDSVHADRDTYGADLVYLWVANIGPGGAAYEPIALGADDDGRSGFGVVRQDQWNNEILAHEFGHNFGCQHDRPNKNNVGFFPYSYGFVEPGGVWKTVMATAAGPTVIPYFSNPNQTYTGGLGNHGPMGVAGDDPNSACDNVRAITNTHWTVANFRPSTLASAPPARVYVRASAAPGGDGASWSTAFKDVQEGISQAVQSRGAVTEVWVAAGVYKPDRGRSEASTVRKMSFRLVEGVTIYGGFAGTETMLAQRNIAANATILDGDIGTPADPSDNTYHVVDGTDLDATAVLDGFTIRNGYADDAYPHDIGGGMRNVCGYATVRNCTFINNYAGYDGGGVGNRFDSSPTFENCMFESNSAGNGGGGMSNEDSAPTLTGCTFTMNSAPNHAGMDSFSGSAPSLTLCNFNGNMADYGGGAGFYEAGGSLNQCTFTGNTAVFGGGGLLTGFIATPDVIDCGFIGNDAGFGGAWYSYSNSFQMMTGCTFTNNTANDGAAGYIAGVSPTLTDCDFNQNHAGGSGAGSGGALVIRDAGTFPELNDCTFNGNTAGCCGGAVAGWLTADPTFNSCDFIDNDSNYGGAVWYDTGANASHYNCRFVGNNGDFGGGAGHTTGLTSPLYAGCTFTGNSAANGSGGTFLNYSDTNVRIINCTLAGNTAAFNCGGILNDDCTGVLTNSLVWQNVDWNGSIESSQISLFNGGAIQVNRSNVQGWTGGFGGTANSGADPQLRDIDGADNTLGTLDDDVRVALGSPAIDSGDNAAVPAPLTEDRDGNARFIDIASVADTGAGTPPIVDRGAFEFPTSDLPPGDFDMDGDVDLSDFSQFSLCFGGPNNPPSGTCPPGIDADLDNDGDVDLSDFSIFALNFTGPL